MKKLLGTLLALALVGCGGSNDVSVPPQNKSLFSLWFDTQTELPLDLTNGYFGNYLPYRAMPPEGGVCACSIIILGTETRGTYSLSSCYVEQPAPAGVGLNCNSLVGAGWYRNEDAILTVQGDGYTNIYR